jgi:glyoxylase-like metal-dependent hydrolase (beta-lactamase superfamily II)
MIYIIRLSDGSLFVVDGGYYFQHSKEANDALFNFMSEIADKQDDGKIRISCWYFTHGHDDHTDGCTRLLTRFHDKINLERVMHGFQSRLLCRGFSPACIDMKEVVTEYYPNVKTLKLHT